MSSRTWLPSEFQNLVLVGPSRVRLISFRWWHLRLFLGLQHQPQLPSPHRNGLARCAAAESRVGGQRGHGCSRTPCSRSPGALSRRQPDASPEPPACPEDHGPARHSRRLTLVLSHPRPASIRLWLSQTWPARSRCLTDSPALAQRRLARGVPRASTRSNCALPYSRSLFVVARPRGSKGAARPGHAPRPQGLDVAVEKGHRALSGPLVGLLCLPPLGRLSARRRSRRCSGRRQRRSRSRAGSGESCRSRCRAARHTAATQS